MNYLRLGVRAIAAGSLCLLAATVAQAAFKDTGWGVRPLGMGGAYTAVVNDSNAPLFNPAGLGQIGQREVTFMSAKLFTGLEAVDVGLNYLGYIHPLSEKAGTFGATWSALSSANLYREDTGNISYGRALNDVVHLGNTAVYGGVSLRYLRREYFLDIRTYDDQVFNNGTQSGALSADAGLLFSWPSYGLSLGLAGKNLLTPDIGLKTKDVVPAEHVVGLAWYTEKLPYLQLPLFTIALDVVSRDGYTDYRTGMETWLFDGTFAIRAGMRPQEATMGMGYEFSVFNESKFILDYALAWPLEVEQTSGSHRLSVSFRFP